MKLFTERKKRIPLYSDIELNTTLCIKFVSNLWQDDGFLWVLSFLYQ